MHKEQELFAEQRNCLKARLVQGAEFEGQYEIPKLKPCFAKPSKAIPFDKVSKAIDKNQWIHFFTDDYRFERVWNDPEKYLERLQSFDGVISPDFSLYRDMPLVMQAWNTYRNRALAYWWQNKGIAVIPNVQWGDERSYALCFDGIPKNSTVAISTNGCIRDKKDRFYFKKGLQVLVEKLEPKTIVNYSYLPGDIFLPYKTADIEIVHLPNWHYVLRRGAS